MSTAGVARLFCSRAKFTRKIALRSSKKLNKKIGACFINVKPKIGQIKVFSYDKMSKNRTSIEFVTGAAKNCGGPHKSSVCFSI